MFVQPLRQEYLHQLTTLINYHLEAVVPGWALPQQVVSEYLQHDYGEFVTDPWVVDRTTLCATEGWRVLAAAHLLRYGASDEVGRYYRDTGEIAFLLALPEHVDAAVEVISAAQAQLSDWKVRQELVCGGGLPVPAFGGVPDAWPHVAEALVRSGYHPGDEHREALYGGGLEGVPNPGHSPVADMELRRWVGEWGTRFSAMREGKEIGHCECAADLTRGGQLPALRGWGEIGELWVLDDWQSRGIGTWLVRHTVRWLKLAGCDRMVISVGAENEARGADRFYRRFGWDVFVRETRSWERAKPPGKV